MFQLLRISRKACYHNNILDSRTIDTNIRIRKRLRLLLIRLLRPGVLLPRGFSAIQCPYRVLYRGCDLVRHALIRFKASRSPRMFLRSSTFLNSAIDVCLIVFCIRRPRASQPLFFWSSLMIDEATTGRGASAAVCAFLRHKVH